jgi:hypothetical protein
MPQHALHTLLYPNLHTSEALSIARQSPRLIVTFLVPISHIGNIAIDLY